MSEEKLNNMVLSGEEARFLLNAIATCPISAPSSFIISLYSRIHQLSVVQPQEEEK